MKEYYKELNKRKEKCIGGHFEDWSELECACEKDLFEFVEEYGIEYRFDEKDAEELLCNEIKEKLKELKAGLRQQDRETTESCKAIINKVSCDKIFYLKKEEEEGTSIVECLQTVDAIEDCSRHIFEQKEFGQYRIWFEREIRLNVVVQNYWKELNRFFERKFEENEFSVLFPMAGYRNSFEIMFQEEEFAEKNMKEEHKELLWNASDAVVSILPFFRMCREYKKLLHSYGLTKTGAIRTKYDFSPLLTAVWNIGIKILSGTITGLSEKFTERYWIKRSDGSLEGLQQKLFYIQQKSDGLVVASNWYKLAYHYLRREEACFIWQNGVGTLRYSEAKNPFYKREEYFKEISEVYSSCGGDGERFEQERYEYKMALQEGVDIPGEPEEYQSFLNCFYYTDSLYNKRKRTYAADVPKYRNMKVNVKDIWTMGIYFDIHGITFQNCVWGNLLPFRCLQFG